MCKREGLFTVLFITIFLANAQSKWAWETVPAKGQPTARHEAGLVAINNKLYLIGGRRINPTDQFDIASGTWSQKSAPPIEIHHFQPVVVGNAIYILGAFTGGWPNEKGIEKVLIYYPEEDRYEWSHPIPENRIRGGAGAVVHQGKILVVGGITEGHMGGFKPWLDMYDPKSGEWTILEDAPNSRDHFQATIVGNKLYSMAGRKSSRATGEDMALTVPQTNIYNIEKGQWEPINNNFNIPTMRAGNGAFGWLQYVVVGGGESMKHVVSHNEIEAFNTKTGKWINWPSLIEGRHGTGYAKVNGYVYTASGSGNRGGGPELISIERLALPKE